MQPFLRRTFQNASLLLVGSFSWCGVFVWRVGCLLVVVVVCDKLFVLSLLSLLCLLALLSLVCCLLFVSVVSVSHWVLLSPFDVEQGLLNALLLGELSFQWLLQGTARWSRIAATVPRKPHFYV